MAVVGLRNHRREERARLTMPRYEGRWRVTRVARVSNDAQGPR